MKIVNLTGGNAVDVLYRDILLPAFPPDELITPGHLREGVRSGAMEASVAVDAQGRILGGLVGDWLPSYRVVLLSYLAVAAEARGTGVGTALLSRAVEEWRAKYRPCLILAEVEDPDHHAGSAAYGDPAARLRFYARQGARALDLPYFQPALSAEQSRVYGVLLLALHVDPELNGAGGADTVAPQPLRAFLTGYLEGAEGGIADDAPTAALWRALEAPGGVPMRSVERLAADGSR
jgi:GNAT superfamily N-acetyltransferase